MKENHIRNNMKIAVSADVNCKKVNRQNASVDRCKTEKTDLPRFCACMPLVVRRESSTL